jgi:hypothetical protein
MHFFPAFPLLQIGPSCQQPSGDIKREDPPEGVDLLFATGNPTLPSWKPARYDTFRTTGDCCIKYDRVSNVCWNTDAANSSLIKQRTVSLALPSLTTKSSFRPKQLAKRAAQWRNPLLYQSRECPITRSHCSVSSHEWASRKARSVLLKGTPFRRSRRRRFSHTKT